MYHFFTVTWPKLGGKARLEPPAWFIKRFGGPPQSNIPGIDFKSKKEERDAKGGKKGGGGIKKKSYSGKSKVANIFNTE